MKNKQISIKGKVGNIVGVSFVFEAGRCSLIRTLVEYNCKTYPYRGIFYFKGILGEEISGRKFEFKQMNYDSGEILENQFLRVWNSDGVGCRDYSSITKK